MRIRCERCATTYELDEKRLPPHGALVKCTRCDHVFRAAPPVAGSVPPPPVEARTGGNPGPSEDERTALFGFATAGEEETASIAAVVPPEPAPARRREPVPAVTATAGPGAGRSGWLRVVLAALLVALAAAAGWYLVQSRAATPTTRLPAGVEFLPT